VSVVYNYCLPSPAQSFSGPSPAGLVTIYYCFRFQTSQPGGPGFRIYIPQEQGGPVIPPGTGFLFVASYDLQGYGGGIRNRLHTEFSRNRSYSSLYSLGTDRTENTASNSSSIVACVFFGHYLATAVV
jgi:hypothetical protein